jgi:DNA polymerase (family 10)
MGTVLGKLSLERAEKTAGAIIKRLALYCERIEVAGSVRRRCPWVNDIDLVLIPSNLWDLHTEIKLLGQVKAAGDKIVRVEMGDTQVDIYFATPETWATLLLIRTGSKENNIRLATRAKKMGWHLAASGDGLFNEKGERVAGDTEESIYEALGLAYQGPEGRGGYRNDSR